MNNDTITKAFWNEVGETFFLKAREDSTHVFSELKTNISSNKCNSMSLWFFLTPFVQSQRASLEE